MEQLTCLVANSATRRVTWDGRDYLVAPLTLIVPGVLAGSKGPLFYPAAQIANSVRRWDNTPIVVYHPVRNGQNVSAQDVRILEDQGIGLVRHPHVASKGRLRGEGWFDVHRTKELDRRVWDALKSGKPLELSTGLYTTNFAAPRGARDPKGRPYAWVATDYRPDHLAILPDQIGACSIRDGCGVLVNQRGLGIDSESGTSNWTSLNNTSTFFSSCTRDSGGRCTAGEASATDRTAHVEAGVHADVAQVKEHLPDEKTWKKELLSLAQKAGIPKEEFVKDCGGGACAVGSDRLHAILAAKGVHTTVHEGGAGHGEEHVFLLTPHGVIIDGTAGQFDRKVKLGEIKIIKPGDEDYGFYRQQGAARVVVPTRAPAPAPAPAPVSDKSEAKPLDWKLHMGSGLSKTSHGTYLLSASAFGSRELRYRRKGTERDLPLGTHTSHADAVKAAEAHHASILPTGNMLTRAWTPLSVIPHDRSAMLVNRQHPVPQLVVNCDGEVACKPCAARGRRRKEEAGGSPWQPITSSVFIDR